MFGGRLSTSNLIVIDDLDLLIAPFSHQRNVIHLQTNPANCSALLFYYFPYNFICYWCGSLKSLFRCIFYGNYNRLSFWKALLFDSVLAALFETWNCLEKCFFEWHSNFINLIYVQKLYRPSFIYLWK